MTFGRVLRGHERRQLQRYLAYLRAKWEVEWETSPHYIKMREENPDLKIEPFGREQVIRSIPREHNGRILRDEHNRILINVSDAFVEETQRRVAGWVRDIKEFGE